MVAQSISHRERDAVSRPTMRPTRVRPASSDSSSALRTPSASSARFRADRHIHEISAMPMNRGQKPMSPSRYKNPAVTSAVSSTVEHATATALRRRALESGFPRRASFSAKDMYFPMTRTGW